MGIICNCVLLTDKGSNRYSNIVLIFRSEIIIFLICTFVAVLNRYVMYVLVITNYFGNMKLYKGLKLNFQACVQFFSRICYWILHFFKIHAWKSNAKQSFLNYAYDSNSLRKMNFLFLKNNIQILRYGLCLWNL